MSQHNGDDSSQFERHRCRPKGKGMAWDWVGHFTRATSERPKCTAGPQHLSGSATGKLRGLWLARLRRDPRRRSRDGNFTMPPKYLRATACMCAICARGCALALLACARVGWEPQRLRNGQGKYVRMNVCVCAECALSCAWLLCVCASAVVATALVPKRVVVVNMQRAEKACRPARGRTHTRAYSANILP